ncbi:hypothetical protein VP01_3300g1 [Puccinia sorghi]|uniref:Uncharacterized protein n=1 Tax=Puccinia sorghi TaxID=27349 RepID=A0A0L6UXF2_9BASI|nr:hypothetical protein VP01_3300g1 [Puccinia sorghi]
MGKCNKLRLTKYTRIRQNLAKHFRAKYKCYFLFIQLNKTEVLLPTLDNLGDQKSLHISPFTKIIATSTLNLGLIQFIPIDIKSHKQRKKINGLLGKLARQRELLATEVTLVLWLLTGFVLHLLLFAPWKTWLHRCPGVTSYLSSRQATSTRLGVRDKGIPLCVCGSRLVHRVGGMASRYKIRHYKSLFFKETVIRSYRMIIYQAVKNQKTSDSEIQESFELATTLKIFERFKDTGKTCACLETKLRTKIYKDLRNYKYLVIIGGLSKIAVVLFFYTAISRRIVSRKKIKRWRLLLRIFFFLFEGVCCGKKGIVSSDCHCWDNKCQIYWLYSTDSGMPSIDNFEKRVIVILPDTKNINQRLIKNRPLNTYN